MKLPSKLTARQQQVLDFLRAFFAENDQLPPLHSICEHFGWRSHTAALVFLRILCAKGYIELNAVGKYRFCRDPDAQPTLAGRMLALPVRDSLPAGAKP